MVPLGLCTGGINCSSRLFFRIGERSATATRVGAPAGRRHRISGDGSAAGHLPVQVALRRVDVGRVDALEWLDAVLPRLAGELVDDAVVSEPVRQDLPLGRVAGNVATAQRAVRGEDLLHIVLEAHEGREAEFVGVLIDVAGLVDRANDEVVLRVRDQARDGHRQRAGIRLGHRRRGEILHTRVGRLIDVVNDAVAVGQIVRRHRPR
jgi:hypothetical protein